MKRLILIALMALTMPAMAQIKSATLTASGLTCSMCSKAIYKALLKVSFISDVQVNVETSTYSLQFKEGTKVVPDDIKKAVEDAGFSVASMQLTASFNNVAVENDTHVVIDGNTFHFLNVPKQELNGDKTFTVIDKNYLPGNKYRQYGKYTKMKCFETGMMEPCCSKQDGVSKRVYHVTI